MRTDDNVLPDLDFDRPTGQPFEHLAVADGLYAAHEHLSRLLAVAREELSTRLPRYPIASRLAAREVRGGASLREAIVEETALVEAAGDWRLGLSQRGGWLRWRRLRSTGQARTTGTATRWRPQHGMRRRGRGQGRSGSVTTRKCPTAGRRQAGMSTGTRCAAAMRSIGLSPTGPRWTIDSGLSCSTTPRSRSGARGGRGLRCGRR